MNARPHPTKDARVRLSAALLAALLLAPGLFFLPVEASCATYSSTDAPGGNGLRPPDTPMKGRHMPVIGAFGDAYGNPVTPDVREEPRKERLPNGAYGGPRQKERPLPNPADETPVW